MEKVAIIIVNWNTGELLARCLQSLVDLPEIEREEIVEVIVVDNNSSDRSIVKAGQVVGKSGNRPKVRFIKQEKNLGFARANNVAIDRIQRREDRPHVLLLNPDTEVRIGAIGALLNVLAEKEKSGVVGPKLLNPDGTLQKSVRLFPTFKTLFLYALKLGSLVRQADIDYEREQEVDQVMGAAFLIRNEVLERVGKLDAGYFMWFEEVDYCKRVKNLGWQVLYTPNGQIMHYCGASFCQLIGWQKTIPWLRSSLRYARNYIGTFPWLMLVFLSPITLLLSVPASLLHLKEKANNGDKR